MRKSAVIGAQTGTYPSVPNYFQSRRVYGNTINNPDTLFFSQSGAYQNMDSAVPPIDSDAIVTTPWGLQVNGIVLWLFGGMAQIDGDAPDAGSELRLALIGPVTSFPQPATLPSS